MNIADTVAFYGENARSPEPGGCRLFHELFSRDGSEPWYPVPWAVNPSISSLARTEAVPGILEGNGLQVQECEDRSEDSLEWFRYAVAGIRVPDPAPLGLHLLMGDSVLPKFENLVRNPQESRIMLIQAVAVRS
jgi:hypothetical protein